MLQILSSLNLVTRMEMVADSTILSGIATGTDYFATGSWAEISTTATGAGLAKKPTSTGKFCLPIWTESNRDKKGGWSSDVAATGQVTVIYGKLHGITDQFTGTPSVGDPLYADTTGRLSASGSGVVVAYCTRALYSTTYLGKKFDAIEFVTA